MLPEYLPLVVGLSAFLAALLLGYLAWARPLAASRRERAGLSAALEETRADAIRLRETRAALDAELEQLRPRVGALEAEARQAAELRAQLAAIEAAAAERERAHEAQLARIREEFERLAAEALQHAQRSFAEQAAETLKLHRSESEKGLAESRQALGELIQPMREVLKRYEEELRSIEQKREQAYGSLASQLSAVAQGQELVRAEASRIVAALRGSARASGAWGEAQLRNVLEMAGLREGIGFTLQVHAADGEGSRRPDAVIRLPGGRELVVDAKCTLDHYLAAVDATDEAARAEALKRHAAALRSHARALAQKAYWQQFAAAADFVVMFVPGENFLSAALEQDLDLLGWALEQRILLAGPTNLLAIARVVAMVWRQERMAEEAQKVAALGADLYQALAVMAEHAQRVGRNIGEAASAYNQFIGSLEERVLAKARRLADHGVDPGRRPIAEPKPAEVAVRPLTRSELLAPARPEAAG